MNHFSLTLIWLEMGEVNTKYNNKITTLHNNTTLLLICDFIVISHMIFNIVFIENPRKEIWMEQAVTEELAALKKR